MCKYCERGFSLVNGETSNKGIALITPNKLTAYGYDTHNFGNYSLSVEINYCPICGRSLKDKDSIGQN